MNNINSNNTNLNKQTTTHGQPFVSNRAEQVFSSAKNIRMSHEEKKSGEAALKKFMQKKEAHADRQSSTPSPYVDQLNAFFAAVSVSMKKKVLVPVLVVLVFGFTVGTTYAASESLPGDVLYSVKINVNENVQSFLAVSPEAKAEVDAEHAANRLEETERLAVQGRLNSTVQGDLTHRFNIQAEEVEADVSSLQSSGATTTAADLSSDFESLLSAHHIIIEALADDASSTSNQGMALSEIQSALASDLVAATNLRFDTEAASLATASSTGHVQTVAQNTLTVSNDLLNEAGQNLSDSAQAGTIDATTTTYLEARLNEAQAVINAGQQELNAGSYNDAFFLLKSGGRIANEAEQTINSIQNSQAILGMGIYNDANIGSSVPTGSGNTMGNTMSAPTGTVQIQGNATGTDSSDADDTTNNTPSNIQQTVFPDQQTQQATTSNVVSAGAGTGLNSNSNLNTSYVAAPASVSASVSVPAPVSIPQVSVPVSVGAAAGAVGANVGVKLGI